MKKVLLSDAVQLNPATKIEKGRNVKFISMDKLESFRKDITQYEFRSFSSGSKFINGDTLLARITPCLENGKTAFVDFLNKDEKAAGSTEFIVIRAIDGITDSGYIYYLAISPEFRDFAIKSMVGTSGRQRVQVDVLSNMKISLPSIEKQKKIANILGSLDEKIELNRRMNETLEQIGQALFRHYFIDNPEREKWNMRELGEFFPVRTGKKDANFSSEDGKYPFFTCSQVVSKAPDFSFDCSAIILAGNGDFNIKYYKGKFEAYQRTYVLSPNKEEFLGFLYFLMKRDLRKITGGSRGSVIKFITKGMIENYKIRLPDDNNILILCIEFNSILDKISQNNIEIATLIKIRDSLLSKLISGEIEV
ncbi:MAG: restriction endonuclease subunit S [Bacteroidota bacterium]|nr:restriction endonuclease subunit S [Bacteroidota bacterium]